MNFELTYYVGPTWFADSFIQLIKDGGDLLLESRLEESEAETIETPLDARINQAIMEAIENPRYFDYDVNTQIIGYLQKQKLFKIFPKYIKEGKLMFAQKGRNPGYFPFDFKDSLWSPKLHVQDEYDEAILVFQTYFSKKFIWQLEENIWIAENIEARQFYGFLRYLNLVKRK